MPKQLNVSLGVTADTSGARKQLQELQSMLTNIVNNTKTTGNFQLTDKLNEAVRAAAELQAHLNAATNVNTGKLDFSKLSSQLKQSGTSLEQYGNHLRQLGPEGQKAFQALATSVANSEIPLKRTNTLLQQMGTTIANSARWEISSKFLHGLESGISTAYRYAQDLNESLNNIRIVTGQNIDQMAQFADQANKAAKSLSATTLDYTNASLIYYQQGLSDSEVQARTDVTIKMANAARESAETISQELTSVWNNFYDGSESLEHFADVMVKLGAETASSSKEIADGVQKFASIGQTVGLSYEYAASALATITATTRESADVVGTALKTLFSRLEGLSLGETLDDGTDLNKYSKALAAVGVQIKDTYGNLKDADTILDETAEKWRTLERDEKMALAQTVAGVRQYAQFMALMENWDFMEENIERSRNADGALQEQADIYAESWEAAQKRVKAAAQTIYADLINDEAFIDLLDAFEDILSSIDRFIQSIGGLKGVLTSLGAIVTKVFHDQLAKGLTDAAYGLQMISNKGREKIAQERVNFIKNAAGTQENFEFQTKDEEARSLSLEKTLTLQGELLDNSTHMSAIELETNQHLLDRVKILGEAAEKAGLELEKANELRDTTAQTLRMRMSGANDAQKQAFSNSQAKVQQAIQAKVSSNHVLDGINEKNLTKQIDMVKNRLAELKDEAINLGIDKTICDDLDNINANTSLDEVLEKLAKIQQQIQKTINDESNIMAENAADDPADTSSVKEARQDVDAYTAAVEDSINKNQNFNASMRDVKEGSETCSQSIQNSKGAIKGWADHIVTAANTLMTATMVINSINGIINTLEDPDQTGWQKFIAIVSTAAMVLPMLASSLTALLPAGTAAAAGEAAVGAGGVAMGAGLTAALGPVGAIILALTALAGIFILVKTAMDKASPEGKLKEAKKDAEKLANSYKEAKTAQDELTGAAADYNNLIDQLHNCTKGTTEWKDKLEEVHNKMDEILDLYPELMAMKGAFNEDGTINQEVLQNAIDNQQHTVDLLSTANASSGMNIAAKNKEVAYTNSDFYLDYGLGMTIPGGSQMLSVTDIEALLQTKDVTREDVKQLALDNYLTQQKTQFSEEDWVLWESSIRDNFEDLYTANADSFEAFYTSLKETSKTLSSFDNTINNIADNIIAEQLAGRSDEEKSMASAAYAKTYQEALKTYQGMSDDMSKGDRKIDEDFFNAYVKALGGEEGRYTQQGNAVLGDDDHREYVIQDTFTGQEIKKSDTDVVNIIAASQALEAMNQAADGFSQSLLGMSSEGIAFANSLAQATNASNNFNATDVVAQWSADEIQALNTAIANKSEDQTNGDVLAQYLGITSEQLTTLAAQWGLDADQMADAILNSTNNVLEKANSLKGPSSATIAEREAYTNAYNNFSNTINEKGLYGSDYSIASENAGNLEGLTKFYNAVSSINLNSEDAAQQVEDLAKANNIEGRTVENLIKWVDGLDKTYNVSTETIETTAAALAKVGKLNVGDIVDSKKAEELKAAGINLEDYFIKMSDGSYKLVAAADAFNQATKNLVQEQYLENINDFKEARNAVSDSKYGFNYNNNNHALMNTELVGNADYSGGQDFGKKRLEYLNQFENPDEIFGSLDVDYQKFTGLDEDAIANMTLSQDDLEIITQMIGAVNDYETSKQSAYLATADTLDEMHQLWDSMSGGNTEAYNNALISLGSKYENCTTEVERFQIALQNNDKTQITAAENELEAAIAAGELAEKYGFTAEELERYADELKISGKYEKASSKELVEMAKDQKRFDKAVISAQSNMDKWNKDLQVAKKTGHLVSETATEMAEAYGDLLDIDGSSLSSDFLNNAENLKLMQKALAGDEEAYRSLQDAARQDIAARVGFDDTEFQNKYNEILQEYYNIDNLDDIDIGAALNDEGFLQELTNLVNAANMTAQEATDYLSSMGIDATVVNKPEEVEETVGYDLIATPGTKEAPYSPLEGESAVATFPTVTYEASPVTTKKTVAGTALEVTSAAKSSGGKVKFENSTPASGGSNSNKPKGGGGGKDSKKPKSKDVERYHENLAQIDNLTKAYDKASKKKDHLFGMNRVSAIEAEIAATNDLISAQNDYIDAIEDNVDIDKNAMMTAVQEYTGMTAEVGADGLISNWTEIMDAAATKYAADESDEADENWDKFEKAVKQYEDTMDLLEDAYAERDELILRNQEAFLEKLQTKLEIHLTLDDNDLKIIDAKLELIGDNFGKIAEIMALQLDKLPDFKSSYSSYETYNQELDTALANGDINQAQYGEAKQQLLEDALSKVSELNQYDQDMLSYYVDTLDWVGEHIDAEFSRFDHLTSVMEHYSKLVDLTNRADKDYYKTKGVLLQGIVENTENEYKASKEYYEMISAQKDEVEKLWNTVKDDPTADNYEEIRNNWQAVVEAEQEAHEQMLGHAEAWAEAAQAVYQNAIDETLDNIDKKLSAGLGTDWLLQNMGLDSTRQDEYLTKTNQIYESNKLLRNLQKDMEKTDNAAAKSKYSAFAKEIEQMREKDELSNLELEIAQAKYKQLQAQIALEEAQNAKNTVRLTQDSEGNFGYVYTADTSAVEDAQQAVEDADNDLYNLKLDASNEYFEKYLQLNQDYEDDLREIWEDTTLTAEEKEARIAEITEKYQALSASYTNLYAIAMSDDIRVMQDSFTTEYAKITIASDLNTQALVEDYGTIDATSGLTLEHIGQDLTDMDTANKNYEIELQKVAGAVGTDYGTMETAVKNLTTESGNLYTYMSETLIPYLGGEVLKNAWETATEYISDQRAEVQGLIADYLALADQVGVDIENQMQTNELPPAEEDFSKPPKTEEPKEEESKEESKTEEQPKSPELSVGTQVTVKSSATNFSRDGGNGTHMQSWVPGYSFYVRSVSGDEVLISPKTTGDYTGWVYKSDLVGFKTGGYTGDWGPDGKFAMLHEKELVLNADDTSNLLKTVDLVRQITAALDVSALGQKLALSNLAASTVNDNREVIEQVVSITAEFPNARDRNEIEAAFGNILNRASQYANR